MSTEDALFPVSAARRPSGRVEAELRRQLEVGAAQGRIDLDLDGALAESALVLAAAVDTAHAVGGLKGGYLAAQAQPALQKALHALRLPTELTAATPPAPSPDGNGHSELSDFLRDLGDALGPS